MTNTAAVPDYLASVPHLPFTDWVARQGLDMMTVRWVADLHGLGLRPWPARGGFGAFIRHEGSSLDAACHVGEIAPGKSLAPQQQRFEEATYILSGWGSTVVWNDAGQRIGFEWRAGAQFAIPLGATYQHFNGSGRQAARMVVLAAAPSVITTGGGPEHMSAATGAGSAGCLDAGLVPDLINLPLVSAPQRGAGGGQRRLDMGGSLLTGQVSQFPACTYKNAHRHGPGEYLIVLAGTGYSLMWPEGGQVERYEWRAGSMIVPPGGWFHQHFNTGTSPARYLAFGLRASAAGGGGEQIDHANEAAGRSALFCKVLADRGLAPRRHAALQGESARLPP